MQRPSKLTLPAVGSTGSMAIENTLSNFPLVLLELGGKGDKVFLNMLHMPLNYLNKYALDARKVIHARESHCLKPSVSNSLDTCTGCKYFIHHLISVSLHKLGTP